MRQLPLWPMGANDHRPWGTAGMGGGSRALCLRVPVLLSCCVLPQVMVKKPLKDETHFEVVESGRFITVLLGSGLSVVWDRHLGISVFLKQTYQVGGPPRLPPCGAIYTRCHQLWAGRRCPGEGLPIHSQVGLGHALLGPCTPSSR